MAGRDDDLTRNHTAIGRAAHRPPARFVVPGDAVAGIRGRYGS
jgi:hypothetical protein